MSADHKLRVVHRNAVGILSRLAATCKPCPELANSLDRLQRWMCAKLLGLFPNPDETPSGYHGRRFRVTSRVCQEHKRWSDVVYDFFLKWHFHTTRRHAYGNQPWFVHLLRWRGPDWLQQQRLARASGTGTRAQRGRPQTRHADIVIRATERTSQSAR